MTRVVRIGRLKRGIQDIAAVYGEDIFVRLSDNNTSFRDKMTGWSIKGNEVKSLPSGAYLSSPLVKAINAGRFVKVKGAKSVKMKGLDLVSYIIEHNEKLAREKAAEGK